MPHDDVSILPPLPYAEWKETCTTLHMWTQIVGKVRLALAPLENHWWNVTLYVTSRGLTTSLMPHGKRGLQIDFDFIDHVLVLRTTDGAARCVPLFARSVAEFHAEVMAVLERSGRRSGSGPSPARWTTPSASPTTATTRPMTPSSSADGGGSLVWSDEVLREFRTRFVGKCSPVHFFWGAFDLAVTRFSGRRAPDDPKAGPIEREAYSHEVISAGFWPGTADAPPAAYYSYTSPPPTGLDRRAGPPVEVVRQTELPAVRPAVRERPDREVAAGDPARLPAEHLRGRRGPREVGSRGAGEN